MQRFVASLLFVAAMVAAIWIATGRNDSGSGGAKDEAPRAGFSHPSSGRGRDPSWQADAGKARSAESLAALKKRFKEMPPADAVSSIEAYLGSGVDHSTGLSFEIGGDSALTGWPTLRTFLLDLLLEIDPKAAARISRGILETPTTADEWAIALRNIGRVEISAEAPGYLREKTEALIRNTEWQAHPSIGYLNAFDVLVHTRATASTPLLSDLIQRKDRKDLCHAGFLTLDRLTQRKPVEMLGLLAADTALSRSRPEMVAQQFARADLRDLAQRSLVRDWLLDPNRKPSELSAFAGIYPNNNQMISNNLLTSEPQLSGADIAKHDRAVLEIIKTWQADPAFQSISPYLETIESRLSEFVGSGSSESVPPTR